MAGLGCTDRREMAMLRRIWESLDLKRGALNLVINIGLIVLTEVLLLRSHPECVLLAFPYAVLLIISKRYPERRCFRWFGDWTAIGYFLVFWVWVFQYIFTLPDGAENRIVSIGISAILSLIIVTLLDLKKWISKIAMIALITLCIVGTFWVVDDAFLSETIGTETFYVTDNTRNAPPEWYVILSSESDKWVDLVSEDGITMRLWTPYVIATKVEIGDEFSFRTKKSLFHGMYMIDPYVQMCEQVTTG